MRQIKSGSNLAVTIINSIMNEMNKATFAPQLFIKNGVKNIDFYTKAFGAIEPRSRTNDDGSLHVAELSINGAIFHLHEKVKGPGSFCPEKYNWITTTIGLFVSDIDAFMNSAIAVGAKEISPAQDYDYGCRQGEIKDPFGHIWMFEMKI
jgi:PhnB protein